MLKIHGYGDNLTINNTRIGNLSPEEHKNIALKKGGNNYKPLENVIVSHVQDSSTLICRKPSQNSVNSYIEEELLDGLCCYSAVNQGQLNKTIVEAVVQHLTEEKIDWLAASGCNYMGFAIETGVTRISKDLISVQLIMNMI